LGIVRFWVWKFRMCLRLQLMLRVCFIDDSVYEYLCVLCILVCRFMSVSFESGSAYLLNNLLSSLFMIIYSAYYYEVLFMNTQQHLYIGNNRALVFGSSSILATFPRTYFTPNSSAARTPPLFSPEPYSGFWTSGPHPSGLARNFCHQTHI